MAPLDARAAVRTTTVVASVGLSSWMTIELDRAIGASLLDAADLEDLGTRDLIRLARLLVQSQYADNLDMRDLLDQVREHK